MDPLAALDQLKPPEGVVLPPREIRSILEKTAGYVARTGAAFEERVRDKERGNPKFSFLNPEDAYNTFYRWRLSEIREGRGTVVAAGRSNEAAAASAAEAAKPKGPPKPADFTFSARMPPISQKDLDIVRLTALFVAKNGRNFGTQIAQREATKAQFQFLMPNHTFHTFFQHLVEQYTTLLQASGLDGEGSRLQDERTRELQAAIDNKYAVLTRAKERANYGRFQKTERVKKEEQEQARKMEFARIDWNDFSVVETIVFDDADEQANLPPPMSLAELQYASLEDRKNVSISANMRIEEAMPTDEDVVAFSAPVASRPASYPLPVHTHSHTPYAPHHHQQAPPPLAQPQPQPQPQFAHGLPPPPPSLPQPVTAHPPSAAEEQPQTPGAPSRGGIGAMKIRDNYVPRAQRAAGKQEQTALCPNCKQMIALDELDEHMRSKSWIACPRSCEFSC
jgi:splicing factor 3A subunit 1